MSGATQLLETLVVVFVRHPELNSGKRTCTIVSHRRLLLSYPLVGFSDAKFDYFRKKESLIIDVYSLLFFLPAR